MTSKVRQRQTNITRFLEASLLRQAEGKLKKKKVLKFVTELFNADKKCNFYSRTNIPTYFRPSLNISQVT